MIFIPGFTGRKWPVILWCLASLFLLIYACLTVVIIPKDEWLWLNLHAIENGRIAWSLLIVLMIWPAWRNLRLGAWLFLVPLSASILLSSPLILSGRMQSQLLKHSSNNSGFSFSRWLKGESDHADCYSYSSPRNANLKSLIYIPKQVEKNTAIVFLLHGGGFYQGAPNWMHGWASALSEQGIAVASLAYPLAPEATFPMQSDEIALSIQDLKIEFSKRQVDTTSIFIAGSSAGGTLALTTALIHSEIKINGVIALYPITDFSKPFESTTDMQKITTVYKGSNSFKAISPIHQIHQGLPPLLLIHGRKDLIVPVEQSIEFVEAWKKQGNSAQFIEFPWATHSFEYPMYGPSGKLIKILSVDFIKKNSIN
jgi:acetyl esterase/lipase